MLVKMRKKSDSSFKIVEKYFTNFMKKLESKNISERLYLFEEELPWNLWMYGMLKEKGYGLQDHFPSLELYTRAANYGFAAAQNSLGASCELGEGRSQDAELAVKWYQSAAKQGYRPSHYNLGRCYEYGIGVELDKQAAIHWYLLASAQGDNDALDRLVGLKGEVM